MLADMSSAHRQRHCFVFFFLFATKSLQKKPRPTVSHGFCGVGRLYGDSGVEGKMSLFA